jgi:hypothetical protein
MSWVSSTIGVVCLAFTEFEFNKVFFFRPLMIVMMVTYFLGCYALPAFLTYLNFDVCRLGKTSPEPSMYFTKSLALNVSDAKDILDGSNFKSSSVSSKEVGSSDKEAESLELKEEEEEGLEEAEKIE